MIVQGIFWLIIAAVFYFGGKSYISNLNKKR